LVRESLEALIICHASTPPSCPTFHRLPDGRGVSIPRDGKTADNAPRAILALSYSIGQLRLSQSRASENVMPDDMHGPDLFEIIRTTRSMWRLKPDVVPNELIRTGTCTPGLSDLPDLSGRVAL
jgi:hypothetical protein